MNKFYYRNLLLGLLLMLSVGVQAQTDEVLDVIVHNAWTTPCAGAGEASAVFVQISNPDESQAIALLTASSPDAMHIQLQTTDENCVGDEVEQLVIPDGETLDLYASGYALVADLQPEREPDEPFMLVLTLAAVDDNSNTLGASYVQVVGVPVLESPPDSPTIRVDTAWARPTAVDDHSEHEMDDVEDNDTTPAFPAAVYLNLRNVGNAPDQLVAVTSPVAEFAEVHQTRIEDDVMRMGAVDAVDLPTDTVVALEPGGYHIMLMQLTEELFEGDVFPLTLQFASGAEQTIAVPVYDPIFNNLGDAEAMEHQHNDQMPITLHFAAMVSDATAGCSTSYSNIGTDAAEIQFSDFRLYVSDIHLKTATGELVPLRLEQDGVWQVEDVALLDFEDGSEQCGEIGNPALNGEIHGTAQADEYVGVSFDLGVPFALNHQDVTTAPSPLNIAAMFWNWQGGYKFLRVDMMTDAEDEITWNIHLGSTGCDSLAGVIAPEDECSRPNRVTITFDEFDAERDVIIADLGALLAGVPLYENAPMPPGCQSGMDDPDCPALFAGLGLSLEDGVCTDTACSTQSFFRVGNLNAVELVERSEEGMRMDHEHEEETDEHDHGSDS